MLRLKSRPQFQAVLSGAVVSKTNHFALHRVDLDDLSASANSEQRATLFPGNENWLGAMAPKRWAKRAVTRNAIKRQIYTVSTSFQPLDLHSAFLIRLRREFSRQHFMSASSTALKTAVREELLILLQSGTVSAKPIFAAV